METEVARHLSDNYGDRAWTVCSLAQPTNKNWPLHGVRLHPLYPCELFQHLSRFMFSHSRLVIEAEVYYALRHEYAQTPIDVLARRTRLAFLNAQAALEALPRVVEIMGEERGWGYSQRRRMTEKTIKFLGSMGL